MKAMKDLQTAIREIKKSMMDEAAASGSEKEMKDMFGESFMAAASDTSKAMSVDEETAKAIKKFISSNRNAGSSSGTGQLRDTLEDMFGSDGTGGAAAAAAQTIADAVKRKVEHLGKIRQRNLDAFAVDVTGYAGSTKYVDAKKTNKKFVSLGALVMYMVGKPLASTRRFDEVQFIWYPVNSKASYLSDLMTAEIPIKIEDFTKKFEENTKTSVNLPLGRFMGMMSSEFIHNQTSYVYGLTKLYETDKEGETKMKEEFSEDATKLNDEKKKRLVDAYGEGEDIEFKMPRIKFHIEAVPARMEDHPMGRMGTILRIHVYDAVCTPYTAIHKLLGAASSNSIGLLSSAAGRSRNPPKYDPKVENSSTPAQHQAVFIEELQKAINIGLLEAVPSTSGTDISSMTDDISKNVSIHYIPDVGDHSKWTHLVDEIIPEYDVVFSNDDFTHELYGKRGKSIIAVDLKSRSDLSGTNIRNLILTDQNWKEFVPSGTIDVLSEIDGKKRLEDL